MKHPIKHFYRRNLPHYQPIGENIFFVTTRLFGSLPQQVLDKLKVEQAEEIKNDFALYAILQSYKAFTAIEANKILERSGQFWQHESYDRVVRDNAELGRIIEYVLNNPVKAGLVENWTDWRYSYIKPSYLS